MSDKVKLNTVKGEIKEKKGAWVLTWPRVGDERGNHRHTFGLLTPYFQGLIEGKLMGTRCTNPKCPIYKGQGEIWLPPRADCPDCHAPMEWAEVKKPQGYIYTYTFVERGGTGLEIECPYYQIDVKIPGVCSIVKSWLVNRDKQIKIGDKVRARFRTGKDATNTCLDLYWELV
jgi:uncharacterized OB-fold protein